MKNHSERNMEYFGTQPIFKNSLFMSVDIKILNSNCFIKLNVTL